jgi:transposase
MDDIEITPVHVGASGFIAAICRELGIAGMINRSVRWDEKQWKVSPGTRAVALIINILVARRPLYRVWESFERLDLPVLFDEPVELNDLNDDGFGRTLDRLHESDELRKITSSVALAATRRLPLGIRSVHADTTTLSLAGRYEPTESDLAFLEENPDRSLLNITYGHSKDKRPDLKQVSYGLVVTSEGMPVLGNVNDGNLSDKVWNSEVLGEIETSFLDPGQIVYVADSALITTGNLEQMAEQKIRFISRLPGTYGLVDDLKEEAWKQGRWEFIGRVSLSEKGAKYRAQSHMDTLGGRPYRFVVVHSDALEKQKGRSLQQAVKRESQLIEKAQAKLQKQRFECMGDAQKALDDFCNEHRRSRHQLKGRVIAENVVKRPPGRPAKDAKPPTVVEYSVEVQVVAPSETALRVEQELAGTFVLITTLPEDEWSNTEILEEYKGQTSVETRFRNLKADPCIVDTLYVNSSRRAEALAYLFLLALIVASYIEVRVRQELKKRQRPFLVPGNRWTERPTMSIIFDILSGVQILKLCNGTTTRRRLPSNIDPRVYELLELTGLDHRAYTHVSYAT